METAYTPAERWADGIIHALGVSFAVGAAVWLSIHSNGALSLTIYAMGLIAMLSASAAYNLWEGPGKELLRRIDHAMIFVMIAGTYTPFVVLRLPAGTATWLGAIVWCGAMAGVVLKLLFPRRFERISIALYIGLGWAVVTVFDPLTETVARSTLDFLVAGGILYTAGVPICMAHRLPFHNAAWHACVLAAAICHFISISGEFT
ncbi:MAG: hemolysin III family protein [Rhodospirillaceae bacterium]|nr:hemolysin III family protein [Rhodospirillales bacterium]